LVETDEVRARTSKKDASVREEEVRKAASEGLLEFVKDEGARVGRETGGSLVVAEIMLYAEGGKCDRLLAHLTWSYVMFCLFRPTDKSIATEALLQPLTSPYPSSDPSTPHPIDLPHTSRLYKTLLQGGHFSHTTHTVTRSPSFSPSAFASSFITIVGEERTVALARGEGAFVVAELLERLVMEGSDSEKEAVKGWFKSGDLNSGEGKGRKVLLEKIAKLAC
jgi:pumilio homology domain family member 6